MTAKWIRRMAIAGCLCLSRLGFAIDFYFAPDTALASTGQTLLVSGWIGPSPLLRGFTVYMAYDTNVIDLYEPPVAGALIANRQGLEFNYFDHPPFAPNVLEVGGTVFGEDFWQGPGELFQMRFIVRQCSGTSITAPYAPFFVDANEGYPPVDFHPALAICPQTPQAPAGLTVYSAGLPAVSLRWTAVTHDILDQPLYLPPRYVIYRQQVLPGVLPEEILATIADTSYVDDAGNGTEYIYHIVAQSNP